MVEFAYVINSLAERVFGPREAWQQSTKLIIKDQWWAGINQNIKKALILYKNEPPKELINKARMIEVDLNYTMYI